LNKPLLIHFYADWCLPCKRMEHESLGHPALLQQLGRQFVGVKVDIDKRKDIARRFKITSLPGDLVLTPDGEKLAQSSGYQATQKYFKQLAAANVKFSQQFGEDTSIAAGPKDNSDRKNGRPLIVARPASRDKANSKQPMFLKSVRVPKPPLGMDGYNPVALYLHRRWQKGDAKYRALYKGIEYRFNSEAEQQQFLVSPERFAPQLLGCDPVILQETDRALNGGTKYAAYFEGRLYLFVNERTRLKFKQQPQLYTKTQHVLRLEDDTSRSRTRRR
jgi:YHS domain-containing protein/thiol-disulfide isomerase/thioredoxin